MKPSVGDRLDLEISKVVHGGYGLARRSDFVAFVKGVLPGERVVATVSHVKKNHCYAELVDVTEASPQRISHIWPEADWSRPPGLRAGGADFGHIERQYQLELKTDVLRESLTRFGGLDSQRVERVRVAALPGDVDGLGWRTRVTLHVSPEGKVGPFAEGTRTVVSVQELPLAHPALAQLGAHRMKWRDRTNVLLVAPSDADPHIVDPDAPTASIRERVGEHSFEVAANGFWQVHRSAAGHLFHEVASRISPDDIDGEREHWDLFAGVGLFSKAIATTLGPQAHVVSVEQDRLASDFARKNLSNHQRIDVVNARADAFVAGKQSTSPLGVVVLDPPRAGAGEKLVHEIAKQLPQKVIYIACDPVALARDVACFGQAGYDLVSIDGLDLFPNTHHMEAIATFIPQT